MCFGASIMKRLTEILIILGILALSGCVVRESQVMVTDRQVLVEKVIIVERGGWGQTVCHEEGEI